MNKTKANMAINKYNKNKDISTRKPGQKYKNKIKDIKARKTLIKILKNFEIKEVNV